ncbi:HEAT repeat domain-containing protein [Skermanella mucosa]|uniref:HEAT repeat domain-containing protein n=1 Tax=Skermanella mucosa TaxID=1789672 RepID=UPI00192BEBF7|nr:HEAT repeat domain-containing protein [Skermanella mucosa]UEM22062.1 HEAT repeat domain-containing protein [Skermanella mucosa]
MSKPSMALPSFLRRYFEVPACVVELAVLGALASGGILVLTTSSAALFLAKEGSDAMPVFYILLAAVSIPLASAVSAVLSRWLTLRVSAALCLASALMGMVLWAMAVAETPGATHAAYIAAYSLEILYDTLFWLLASEYLTTLDMKRHAAQLAMAFGAGGVGGGLIGSALSHVVATQTLFLVSSVLFGLALLQCLRIGRRLERLGDGEDEDECGILDALRSLGGTIAGFPLIAAIGLGILLMSALFCLQDYLAMVVYAEAFEDEDALAGFLALVYSAQQAAELVILALFGRLVLERGSPLLRNLIFPATTLLSLAGLFLVWGLPAAIVMHMNANAVSNAIFEPVKTLNYAAIPYRVLGQVRMLVEGAIYPAGIALSGVGLLWLQGWADTRTVLLVTMGLAALFAAVCASIGVGFLPSLLKSLRRRAAGPLDSRRRGGAHRFSRADILALHAHPDPQVRRHAGELARKFAPDLALDLALDGGAGRPAQAPASRGAVVVLDPVRHIQALARMLEQGSAEARQNAAEALGRCGDAAVPEILPRLASRRPEVANAAVLALGAIGTRRARRILLDHLAPLYRQAHYNLHGLAAVTGLFDPSQSLVDVMTAAIRASNRRIIWRVLMVKAALGNKRDIRLLYSLAHSSDARIRADAIEALSSLPTGRFIRPVLALLEAGAGDAPPAADSPRAVRSPTQAAGAVMRAASADRWTRLLAARLLDDAAVPATGENAMLDLILFLKTLPLFQALTLEEVGFLAERAETATPSAGTSLFEAGEPIRYLSVIRAGTAELRIDGVPVDRIGAGGAFGETAFLEDASYPLGGIAVTDMVVLRFHRALIADLVAEHPMALPPLLADWQRRLARLYGRLAEQTAPGPGRTGARLQLIHRTEIQAAATATATDVHAAARQGSPDECA